MKIIKKKICFITTNRSDFGILKNLIARASQSKKIDASLAITGSHFSKTFGNSLNEINLFYKKKKFYLKVYNDIKHINFNKIFQLTLKKFLFFFKKKNFDIVVVLGDRQEMLAVSIAAMLQKQIIAHIHGGEVTSGSMDDKFRHMITKIANVHFVANNIYRKRVIQLGENPKTVFNVGSLSIENIKNLKFFKKEYLQKKFNIKFKKKNLIISMHIETENSKKIIVKQVKEFFSALNKKKDIFYIFTAPSPEQNYDIILNEIRKFIKNNKERSFYFPSLGKEYYFSFINISDGMIGNSSSGIIEVPSFKKATINLGNRQNGRLFSKSIINSNYNIINISNAIDKLYSSNFQKSLKKINNPYFKKDVSKNVIKELIKLNHIDKNKLFYDLK